MASARRRRSLLVGAALLVYLGILAVRRDEVPQGLNEDVAEEAWKGLYVFESGRFEPMTFVLGYSAETLYLYVMAASVSLFGPTSFALQAPSWAAVLLALFLLLLLVRRLQPSLPLWAPLLVAFSCLWLLHYGRTGLRAIASVPVVLGVALLAGQALGGAGDKPGRSQLAAAGAGALAGIGVYAYTSCRLLPLALIAFFGWHWQRAGDPAERRRLSRLAVAALAAMVVVSLPNLIFFSQHPSDFLERGGYAVRGGIWDWLVNLAWTVALPVHYPSLYGWTLGPGHYIDGVSITFEAAALDPIHPLVGLGVFIGLANAWRRRAEPLPSFLLITWLAGSVLLGFIGPSLTRMLVLLPVYLAFAAMGVAAILERSPRAKPAIAALLLLTTSFGYYEYFVGFRRSPDPRLVNNGSSSDIGQRAAAVAARGQTVLCVVRKDVDTVRFFVRDQQQRVEIAEFWNRPLVQQELKLDTLRPAVLLVERHPAFDGLVSSFPPERRTVGPAFTEIRAAGVW